MPPELTERQAFLVLNDLPNVGPMSLRRLLEAFDDDPRAILSADRRRLETVRGVGPETSASIVHWGEHVDLEREEERLARAGATFITARDSDYPELLKRLPDAPIGLYRKGDFGFDLPCIAIVGSRRTTLYGITTAKKLAADLCRLGFCIVSGLARGIDTAAHEGALSVGGRTVGVLGTGIDIVYPPENLDLYRRVEASGGIFSEFPFGRRADRQSFAMRNRIVSGVSDAVVVVESDVSGGAMITARFAGEQGKLLFAVPGRIDQPSSAGCHQLIRDGATLLTSVDDILSELNYLDGFRPQPIPSEIPDPGDGQNAASATASLDESERTVIEVFTGGAILTIDTIAALTGLPSSEVSAALLMLELKHLVTKRADGTFEPGSRNVR